MRSFRLSCRDENVFYLLVMHTLIFLFKQIFHTLWTNLNCCFVGMHSRAYGIAYAKAYAKKKTSSGLLDRSECLGRLLVKLQFIRFHRVLFANGAGKCVLLKRMFASGPHSILSVSRAGQIFPANDR